MHDIVWCNISSFLYCQVTMFGEGPQPQQFMKKQKPKKEKGAKEGHQTRHTAREDKELPPNFKMKNPVQV